VDGCSLAFNKLNAGRAFFLRINGMNCDGRPDRPTPGEVSVEESAAMGTVYTVPADPHKGSVVIDYRPGAPGWETWRRLTGW
jgi:hypothetical protein